MSIENWSELRDKTLGVNENYKYKASKLNEIGKQGWPWCYWVWFCIWLVDKLCKFSGPIIEQRKSKYKAISECFGHSIIEFNYWKCLFSCLSTPKLTTTTGRSEFILWGIKLIFHFWPHISWESCLSIELDLHN